MAGVVMTLTNGDPLLEDDTGAGRARKKTPKTNAKPRRKGSDKKRTPAARHATKDSRVYRAMTSQSSDRSAHDGI